MNNTEYRIKRFFDYAVAGTGLAVSAIPIVSLAVIMGAVNKSTPFFVQDRIGKDGKIFQIYKIKTLKDIFDEAGNLLPDHERSTVIGTFLRKTRLDELPQLLNILKGDMSIVGPRPAQSFDLYAHDPLRQSVLPGLLGASQVRLGRGHQPHEKLKSDQDYVENQSLVNDLKIILEAPLYATKRFRISDFFKPAIH